MSGIVCLSDDYYIAGQNPIKFHKEFTILNDTNVTIPAALRIQIRILSPTHTRVADEELDRKEYDKNNLITITTLNFGIAKHTVRTTR